MRKFLRIFISRYALSAIFLLADIALLAYLAFYAYVYSFILVLLASTVNLLVIISLINKDTNPEFKLTWLAIVTMVPILGGLIYLFFRSRKMKKKESRYLKTIVDKINEFEEESGGLSRSAKTLDSLSQESETGAGRAFSVLRGDKISQLYSNCSVTYYDSGESFFGAFLEALRGAKKYIFLEYFIVEDGKMWRAVYDIIKEKAALGVDVRLLYDDIGCMSTLPFDFDRRMRLEGIKCRRFAKVTPKFSVSYNNRDHRKICSVDGRIAFTGGMNIADEYINEKERFGHWKDGGVSVLGEAALGFSRLFLLLYDYTAHEFSDYSQILSPLVSGACDSADETADGEAHELSSCILKNTQDSQSAATSIPAKKGYLIPFGSGPSPVYAEPVGKNALMNIINASKRYLYITTPYLIIDYDITEALRSAAGRGVDVRIITPSAADKRLVKIMTKSAYPYLISAGVRIFEYTPGFIHEKLIVSDDRFAVVSTINFDYRSLVHHFEDGLWIFGDEVIFDIRDSFMKTECVSREIDAKDARLGLFEKTIRSLIRILAPLL